MSDANTELMQLIQTKWGAAIAAACDKSSVPPAFLAALIANETGGNPDARRFEKGVLASLWEVVQGRVPAYGSILRDSILAYLAAPFTGAPASPLPGIRVVIADALQQLDGLATSWGLTQVMGYEAIPFSIRAETLADPNVEFPIDLRMLAGFAVHYGLDMAKDFDELFDCWNTGRPHSQTADPQYIPNGLARMAIYGQLAAGPPAEAPGEGG